MIAGRRDYVSLIVLLAAMMVLPVGAATGNGNEPLLGLRPPASLVQATDSSAPFNSGYLTADYAQSDESKPREPFPWRATPPDTPDYKGAARDTGYFMLYQALIIGVIYLLSDQETVDSEEG